MSDPSGQTEATYSYQCPNCGGDLRFDAAKQCFVCEFCLSDFTKEQMEAVDSAKQAQKQAEAEAEAAYNEEMVGYHCATCGAEGICPASTSATFCAYCHNPVLLTGKLSGEHRPHKMIPFKLDRAAATDVFLKFAKKRIFAPRDFTSQQQLQQLTGIYYPFWVTDADADADLSALGERIRVWRTGNTEYTETSHYRFVRQGAIHFEDITTNALSEADKKMLEGILPYPSEAMEAFSMPYLSGFYAKRRDIARTAVEGEVRGRMDTYAQQLLKGTIKGYSGVRTERFQQKLSSSHWDDTLLPVWILTYIRKRKTYTYAINGHTGKIYGNIPVSVPKILALFGAVAALVTLLCFFIGGLL